MTKKQLKFVDEYLLDFNASQAAIRAGFSAHTSTVQGSRLLANVNIAKRISERLEVIKKKDADVEDFTHSQIRTHFKHIYDRCMQGAPVMRWDAQAKEFVPLEDEAGNAVWQFDSGGANRAMENIAKNKGFYELDNSQKRNVINVSVKHNTLVLNNTNTDDASHRGELTDGGILTVLPAPADRQSSDT